jgi:hypothetical protein
MTNRPGSRLPDAYKAIMNPGLKWSLIVGVVLSLSLHRASAVVTVLYPYHDEPMTPKLVFIYLLLPGWLIAGRGYHFQLWREAIAVAINGALYGMFVFCLLAIWNRWRRGARMSDGARVQRPNMS